MKSSVLVSCQPGAAARLMTAMHGVIHHGAHASCSRPSHGQPPSWPLRHNQKHDVQYSARQHCFSGRARRAAVTCSAQLDPQEEAQQQLSQDGVETVQQASQSRGPAFTKFVLVLFVAGAIMGPLLDGIHGTVELNVYDSFPFSFLGLHSSAWVPPLLGAFYAVAGGLLVSLDYLATSDVDVAALKPLSDPLRTYANIEQTWDTRSERTTLPNVALATGALAYLLELSANLYGNGVPYLQIHLALALSTVLNWLAFDGTRQGIALAAFIGIAAPVSELVIMRFGLWHYPKPDLLGLPSWVAWCYAFYAPALSNLARSIWIWADSGEVR